MMGLYNTWSLKAELSAFAHTSIREDFRHHLEKARQAGGMRNDIQTRDAPF
ncbi:hypothetical protein NKDENANG_03202 [Candidatus Entotheonellaceae bacterium PAL068K]